MAKTTKCLCGREVENPNPSLCRHGGYNEDVDMYYLPLEGGYWVRLCPDCVEKISVPIEEIKEYFGDKFKYLGGLSLGYILKFRDNKRKRESLKNV